MDVTQRYNFLILSTLSLMRVWNHLKGKCGGEGLKVKCGEGLEPPEGWICKCETSSMPDNHALNACISRTFYLKCRGFTGTLFQNWITLHALLVLTNLVNAPDFESITRPSVPTSNRCAGDRLPWAKFKA